VLKNLEQARELIKKGTTTVGIKCKNGVVLVADKRVSMGYLNAHQMTKIHPITDRIGMTMAGGVGDNQMILKYLRAQMRLIKIRTGKEPSVKSCANLLSNILYGGKGGFFPFYVQVIIAGLDNDNVFRLYTLTPDGSIVEEEYVSTGSGSVMAYGLLDDALKNKKGLQVKQAAQIGLKALSSAIKRDIYTGNGVDLVTITEKGFKRYSQEEIKKLMK